MKVDTPIGIPEESVSGESYISRTVRVMPYLFDYGATCGWTRNRII
jgi:hypothetical protein